MIVLFVNLGVPLCFYDSMDDADKAGVPSLPLHSQTDIHMGLTPWGIGHCNVGTVLVQDIFTQRNGVI